MRSLLASGTPGLASGFTSAARARLRQTNAKALPNSYTLFTRQSRDGKVVPTQNLNDILRRARSLYGAGMGFASLGILASVVRATVGMQWDEEGDMADILVVIDADIGQAIQARNKLDRIDCHAYELYFQSCKEEIDGGRIGDFTSAHEAVNDLRMAVNDSLADVESWGGEFPFERAVSSIEYWKI